MNTRYRIVSDGHAYYLQYLKVVFHIFKWWEDVPVAHRSQVESLFIHFRYNVSLNAYNKEYLENFAKRWPDIRAYLDTCYAEELRRLRKVQEEKDRERDQRSREVINL